MRLLTLVAVDVLLAFAALFTGFIVRFGFHDAMSEMLMASPVRQIIFVAVLVFSSYIFEIYRSNLKRRFREIMIGSLVAVVASFILLTIIYYVSPNIKVGRGLLTISLIAFTVYQSLWHQLHTVGFSHPSLTERVLVLGAGPLALRVGELIEAGRLNFSLAGFIACDGEQSSIPTERIVGKATDLMEVARREGSSTIVVALSERRGVFPLRDVLRCKLNGVKIEDAPSFYEKITGKLMLENITPSWLIFSSGFRRTAVYKVLKRICDIVLSVVGLCLFFPFFPLLAIMIKIDSPGPVLFRQVRVGNWERNFMLYKFRTMRTDAESASGAVWAQKDDPRVTKLGRFLRKSRLDELPQLFNVLRGDMSFVGPRPERPEFVEKLKEIVPFYSKRHFVQPGLTGWAQVSYPYGATIEDALEKLRYDLFYIKNMSPIFDVLIILETIKVVLFGKGAR